MNTYYFEDGMIYDCEDGENAVLICDPYLSYKHAQFSSGGVIMIDIWAEKVIGYNGEIATPKGYNEAKTKLFKSICEELSAHYRQPGRCFPAMYNVSLERDGGFRISWTALNIGAPKAIKVQTLGEVMRYTSKYPTEAEVYKYA